MIHAINPYGFAWCRRVTQENVDLNRNWTDFGRELPSNTGYDTIAEILCPTEWDERSVKVTEAALQAFIAAQGMSAFTQAVSGGQYHHPTGLVYGGRASTWSRRTQTTIFAAYLGSAEAVGIIDYHTGLGPFATLSR